MRNLNLIDYQVFFWFILLFGYVLYQFLTLDRGKACFHEILFIRLLLPLLFSLFIVIVTKAKFSVRMKLKKIIVLIWSLGSLLLISEYLFPHIFVLSDGFNQTLMSKRWFKKYWYPINSQGYRDDEHSFDSLKNKKTVVVLGDSFVAGHGINNYKDRFSNLLQTRLGDNFVVMNIAQCGWQTKDEVKALKKLKFKPDILIHSYYLNDVIDACDAAGVPRPPSGFNVNSCFIKELLNSYIFNYIYWLGVRYNDRSMNIKTYNEYLSSCYENPKVWNLHKAEIDQIISYANLNKIDLNAIVFPILSDIQKSEKITEQVRNYYQSKGVKVVDMGSILKGRNSKELVVNSLDAHPNKKFQPEIADLLFETINK